MAGKNKITTILIQHYFSLSCIIAIGTGSRFAGTTGRMDASQASQEMVMLNINQRVTALAAGNLNPEKSNNDILLIGTPTNLLGWFPKTYLPRS